MPWDAARRRTGKGRLLSDFAVIFDNDGVLVDSEGISAEAFIEAARDQGVEIDPASMEHYCGLTDAAIAEHLARTGAGRLDLPRFEERKHDLYFEKASADPGVVAFPGARSLVEALRAAGVPVAVASSGSARKVAFNLEKADLADLFPLRISSQDVQKGKPDPEVFLKAAAFLQIDPSRCAVVEDSINGLKAARAAGAFAVAVTTTFTAAQLAPYADWIVPSLKEITLPELRRRHPLSSA